MALWVFISALLVGPNRMIQIPRIVATWLGDSSGGMLGDASFEAGIMMG